jgi:hypothetical protein
MYFVLYREINVSKIKNYFAWNIYLKFQFYSAKTIRAKLTIFINPFSHCVGPIGSTLF